MKGISDTLIYKLSFGSPITNFILMDFESMLFNGSYKCTTSEWTIENKYEVVSDILDFRWKQAVGENRPEFAELVFN